VDNKRREVIVLDFDPIWKEKFLEIKKYLEENLQDIILRIEHIGSTSVEGLAAKPIIDIDVVCERDKFIEVKSKLESLNFRDEGDLGVPERFAFKRNFKDNFFPYHLYVCYEDSKGYLDHINFRNFLRNNKEIVKEYSILKKKLARENQFDINGYMNAKDDFNKMILKLALK